MRLESFSLHQTASSFIINSGFCLTCLLFCLFVNTDEEGVEITAYLSKTPENTYSAGTSYLHATQCPAHVPTVTPYNCNPIPAFSCLGDKQLAAWADTYNRNRQKPVP
jgi:hypothetical protein